MPIYEEKLISPFAVRFTQEHIKTTFRDGRSVEAAITEIQERPGAGSYDVVLQFPFPAIEIVRWCAPPHEKAVTSDSIDNSEEVLGGDHWFTLDNRRLYCLQRAAAACWPRRVAIAVEILYASRGSVKRKCDTTTCGRSVTIAHSIRDQPISRWDWRSEVQCRAKATDCAVCRALETILCDDEKPTVSDLLDLPGESMSAVERALAKEVLSAAKRPGTPSTAEPSDESDPGSAVATPRGDTLSKREYERIHACELSRRQVPCDEADNTYWNEYGGDASDSLAWWAIQEINQQLHVPGNNGYVWIANWNDVYAPYLGSLRVFLANHPDHFTVIPGKGRSYRVTAASQTSFYKDSWRPQARAQRRRPANAA